jgi:hypothetical protein
MSAFAFGLTTANAQDLTSKKGELFCLNQEIGQLY